jgi:hypothetical protein
VRDKEPRETEKKLALSFLSPVVLLELELELIQTQMAQKPMLRAEVGMRVRCAKKASAE